MESKTITVELNGRTVTVAYVFELDDGGNAGCVELSRAVDTATGASVLGQIVEDRDAVSAILAAIIAKETGQAAPRVMHSSQASPQEQSEHFAATAAFHGDARRSKVLH